MGFLVNWSPFMERHAGQPVKNLAVHVGREIFRGEAIITSRGLEGGVIYLASSRVREGEPMFFDLLPDLPAQDIADRWGRPRGKESFANALRKRFKLDPVKIALLNEFVRPIPDDISGVLKKLPIPVEGPVPIDEAISTAGGVCFDGVTADLMLKDRPGVFVAGEMLDWEAPTGGYLITACLATGLWAGKKAAAWADQLDAAL
jgi:predicted flavoprotein YhiN